VAESVRPRQQPASTVRHVTSFSCKGWILIFDNVGVPPVVVVSPSMSSIAHIKRTCGCTLFSAAISDIFCYEDRRLSPVHVDVYQEWLLSWVLVLQSRWVLVHQSRWMLVRQSLARVHSAGQPSAMLLFRESVHIAFQLQVMYAIRA
jgi:hypothetical protein